MSSACFAVAESCSKWVTKDNFRLAKGYSDAAGSCPRAAAHSEGCLLLNFALAWEFERFHFSFVDEQTRQDRTITGAHRARLHCDAGRPQMQRWRGK
jgi:hypothetical protein